MVDLIPVGFFREQTDDPEEQRTLPSIRDFVELAAHECEEKVLNYLRNGHCYAAKGGWDTDVLDLSCQAPLFRGYYTDGAYFWPQDLAYYVEKYHLRLPQAFLDHMAAMNWQPPPKESLALRFTER
jgi:hypothetical protein